MLSDTPEAEMEGAAQQPIWSCLQVLDTFLAQKDAVVVSSIVVREKQELQCLENVVDAILRIVGGYLIQNL